MSRPGLGCDRVVGNRPAGRDGWAQPGHRLAPGNETPRGTHAPRTHPPARTRTRYASAYFVSAAGSSASR